MKTKKRSFLAIAFIFMIGILCAGLIACSGSKKARYTFVANGGAEIAAVEVVKGEEFTLPEPEAREGYAFNGWFDNEACTGTPVTKLVADGSLTFYASWTQLSPITLELDGGTLSGVSANKLYLKESENVYNFMQNYVPVKSGLQFGAWYKDDTALGTNERMPKDGITLTAKYKVEYTIELWKQKLDLSGYEKDGEVKGSDFVGAQVTPDSGRQTGFEAVSNAGEVLTKTLSATASENIFKHYFNRLECTVVFHTNLPDGGDETETKSVIYGKTIALPDDYRYEGYLLAGWSTSPTGGVEHKVNPISSWYNQEEGQEPEEVMFAPESDMPLYAVWTAGYRDMFEGGDYLYLLSEDDEYIYLSRGDKYFRGDYYAQSGTFEFEIDRANRLTVQGKLFENNTFIYADESRRDQLVYFFESGEGLDQKSYIRFGLYNEITFKEEENIDASEGTYKVEENGNYVATFTDGPRKGTTFTFIIGYARDDNGVQRRAFQIRNEEEVALGKLYRFGLIDGKELSYYPRAYDIELNGFGTATYNTGTSLAYYSYLLRDGVLTLRDNTGRVVQTCRFMKAMGRNGYMLYTPALDQEFTLANGATLKLDGACNATYTKDGTTVAGYYTSSASRLDGTVVTLTGNNRVYSFLITSTSETVPGENEGDEEQVITTYTVTEKPEGYAEYFFRNEGGTYIVPLLVVNDEAVGKASLYSMTNDRAYAKVSSGSIEWNAANGYWIYTVENDDYAGDFIDSAPIDVIGLKKLCYGVNTTASAASIYFWYSAEYEGVQVPAEYAKTYTGADGAKITLVSGVAIHQHNTNTFTGLYSVDEETGIITITTSEVSAQRSVMYIEIDEAAMTFTELEYSPFNAYMLNADGTQNRDVYLAYDGKGGAVYTTLGQDGKIVSEVAGTITEGDVNDYDVPVSTFASDTLTFNFLQLSSSTDAFFSRESLSYRGSFSPANGGAESLRLDGFSYYATYRVGTQEYTGRYLMVKENIAYLTGTERDTQESREFYFVLNASDENAKTYAVLGDEYGVYQVMDNRYAENLYFDFDGRGTVRVYRAQENGGDVIEVDIERQASYTKNGNKITVTYTDNGKTVAVTGERGYRTVSSSSSENRVRTFFVSHEEAVYTYVNEKDWSILTLDASGNAVKYDTKGVRDDGTYTLINDHLLYYANNSGDDAYIYEYDTQALTATPIQFDERAYYTENLDALLFSEYGFAVFNGTTIYYYYYDKTEKNPEVTIYHFDETASGANKYGFVEENFGTFEAQKTYNDLTYYRQDIPTIEFVREGNDGKYPVTFNDQKARVLTNVRFIPSGDETFSVSGTFMFESTEEGVSPVSANGTVVRERDENDNLVTYAVYSGIRFYFDATYVGASSSGEEQTKRNTFAVTGMRSVTELASYRYYDDVYAYYTGAIRNVDEIHMDDRFILESVYNEAGEVVERYATGLFAEDSAIRNTQGKVLSFERMQYTRQTGADGQETGPYTIVIKDEDGYTYRLYFGIARHTGFTSAYGYTVIATREQTLSAGDYSVKVERIIAAEGVAVSAGSVYSLELTKGGVEQVTDRVINVEGKLYYLVRVKGADEKVTEVRQFVITLTEDSSGEIGEESNEVVPYHSVAVEETVLSPIYTSDERGYLDVDAENNVKWVYHNARLYYISESSYNEDTNEYTAVTSSGRTFRITVTNGVAAITVVSGN